MYTFFKILLTALIVVVISEVAKRSSLLAGIIASIPLTSLLAFVWIYFDTQDTLLIKDLSKNILLMIPPSLTFFIGVMIFLDWKVSFYTSVMLAVILTGIVYWLYFYILNLIGINLT